MTINKLMDKYNLLELEYLFIDAEGLDVFIIDSLEFNKYNYKNIIFEAVHSDGPFTQGNNLNYICSMLTSIGYDISQYDSFCLKASK